MRWCVAAFRRQQREQMALCRGVLVRTHVGFASVGVPAPRCVCDLLQACRWKVTTPLRSPHPCLCAVCLGALLRVGGVGLLV
jgi:hypothetical protein